MKQYTKDEKVNNELEMLAGIIVETVPVEAIYLFGSYARGTPHKDSDLDLYVALKDEFDKREIDAMVAIGRAICREKTLPVDILALKKSKFLGKKEFATMERTIATEGIKIYG
jgi:predicted nucleotidyltransferase